MKNFTKEDAYKNLERINFWISNCDTKASFILAFNGVILGFIGFSGELFNSLKTATEILFNCNSATSKRIVAGLVLLFTIVFLILICLSILRLIKSLTAKIDSKVFAEDGLTTNSMIHFQSIGNSKFTTFENSIKSQTEESIINDINSQVYINSKICTEKFKNYNIGIYFLKTALIVIVLLFLIIYLLKLL